MKKAVVSVLMILCAAALLFAFGCSKPEDDYTAAADVLENYLDAFNAKDAEALADTMYCEARYETRSREDVVEEMQGKIDSIVDQFGENFHYVFDREDFAYGDATQQMNTLNEFLGLTDADVKVDAAKLVSVELYMTDSAGEKYGPQLSTIMAYRYDGEWYYYGAVD